MGQCGTDGAKVQARRSSTGPTGQYRTGGAIQDRRGEVQDRRGSTVKDRRGKVQDRRGGTGPWLDSLNGTGKSRSKTVEERDAADESGATETTDQFDLFGTSTAEVADQFEFFGMTYTTERRVPDNDRAPGSYSNARSTSRYPGTGGSRTGADDNHRPAVHPKGRDTARYGSSKAIGGFRLLAVGETMPRKTVRCHECDWMREDDEDAAEIHLEIHMDINHKRRWAREVEREQGEIREPAQVSHASTTSRATADTGQMLLQSQPGRNESQLGHYESQPGHHESQPGHTESQLGHDGSQPGHNRSQLAP